MTETQPTSVSDKSASLFLTPRRLVVLAGAVVCCFLVAAGASQLYDGSQQSLRRSQMSVSTSSSLQSWMSFNQQTSSLGLTAMAVDTVTSRSKVMELKDPDRFDIASNDEEVIVKIIEHKDPDLSESGTDEFKLEFVGDEDVDQHDVEVSLSKALRSGLRDPDQIAKAVSESLNQQKGKVSNQHKLPQQASSLKDKP